MISKKLELIPEIWGQVVRKVFQKITLKRSRFYYELQLSYFGYFIQKTDQIKKKILKYKTNLFIIFDI